MVALAQGWKLNNTATPGFRVADGCPSMYGTPIRTSSYSATLIGANDFWAYVPPPAAAVSAVQIPLQMVLIPSSMRRMCPCPRQACGRKAV
jgi:hypothetical protein